MKMLTKQACERALQNLRSLERKDNFEKYNQVAPQVNCDVLDQLIKEHFELVEKIEWLKEEMTEPAFNLVFSTQEFLHNWYKGIQMYSSENAVLQRKVNEYENPQPYIFEDLKEDVWVWDDVFKEMCFISSIIDRNKIYIEYLESHCSLEPCKILFFEEGRFFPITKALEY